MTTIGGPKFNNAVPNPQSRASSDIRLAFGQQLARARAQISPQVPDAMQTLATQVNNANNSASAPPNFEIPKVKPPESSNLRKGMVLDIKV